MDETNTEISDITTEDKHDTENEKVSHETFGKSEVPDIMTKVLEFRDNAHVNNVRKLKGGIDSLIDIDSIYTRVSAPKRKLDEKIDTIITNVRSESGTDAADDTDSEVQDESKTDDTPNEFQNEGSVDETPNETQDKVSDNIEQEEQTP